VTKGNRLPKNSRNIAGIGQYLTEVRVAKGITQRAIADKLGKTVSCISKIETEDRTQKTLHGITLFELADAYGISIIDIMKNAQWLQLPLITTLTDSTGHSDDPLLTITAEERSELIRYLVTIRSRK
jgi:transcriptional regulator with XRE-family HTH domain